MKDEHIAEMTNINLSLHTLGKCISALAQASIQRQKASFEHHLSTVTFTLAVHYFIFTCRALTVLFGMCILYVAHRFVVKMENNNIL